MPPDEWARIQKQREIRYSFYLHPLATPLSAFSTSYSSNTAPTMPTLRIPDILGAMDGFELRTHPDERQVSRETNEWFARYNFSI